MMFTTRAAFVRTLLASLLVLQSPGASLASKGDNGCRRTVCVSASVEGDVVNYEVTGMTQPVGWIGLGFGTSMLNTHMVIMWQNVDGSTTLSQRYTSSYSEPRPENDPPRLATLVKPKALTRPAKTTTFAFTVPANRSLLASTDPKEHLIFAFSPVRPEKDASSPITRHHDAGYITLDFSKDFKGPDFGQQLSSSSKSSSHPIAQGTNKSYKKIERLIILHGALVSLGFLVLLPAGSLIGRWARTFTPRWFKLHQLSNGVIALPVITFGVVLGPVVVASKESYRTHFANDHEKYGAVLLLLYYAQVLLGRYIHNRRMELAKLGPITQPHPPLNIFHICLGLTIIGLSFLQIRTGLGWWESLTGRGPITSWALPLWKAWSIILPLAYFAGFALLPRQLRLEKEAAYAPLPAVTVDERAQATHLLGEDEEDRAQSIHSNYTVS